MKLTFYKGDTPNFGDDLNNIMWDALVAPGFFDDNDDELFLGIGSILWDYLPKTPKKIVMGSGYGGYSGKPNLQDGSWDVAFVRGPRTAKALNLDPKLAITDAAILTRFMNLPAQTKKYKVSFMPHWESISRGNWQRVCEHAGINYIDPTDPNVLASLQAIQQTELLITEAMHGAILADTLRVPWLALEPIFPLHRNKWFDWSESMSIDLKFNATPSSSIKDLWSYKTGNRGVGKFSQQLGNLFSFTDSYFIDKAAENLSMLAKKHGQLSDDQVFINKSNMAFDKLSQYCKIKSL
ncbi:polysaccharide pyruvyl transferase family protein [Pseudoalteromonas sp. ND6B]|uniref:polysaccharide pyruvyl transferase family protein n=1 Tax=Pseudoalteromonas sp. ND6B TaxID=1535421 RepID=UPI00051A5CD2|nr:polysaccharide pyruvyl transferase family protein [Pseudoalteromonas sp. ND6B]KGK01551.1 polysaccharide pyruvyl transferase [Pseudoalteromonas sp. ND6B]